MKTILLIIALLYILVLFDFNASFETKKFKYTLDYSGLLWVGLDHWSINKYHSDDKPMKWFRYSRLEL